MQSKTRPKLKFFDLFGGIGAFRLAMEHSGHECIGYLDKNKHAVAIYNHNFQENYEPIDANHTDWNHHPKYDCLCAGFSCKPYSRGGDRSGLDHPEGDGITLVTEVLAITQPPYFLFENVPDMVIGSRFRDVLADYLEIWWKLGYTIEWQICDSRDFGSPQRRNRVYIAGYPREQSGTQIFPLTPGERVYLEPEYYSEKDREWFWGEDCVSTLTANYKRGVHCGGETYIRTNHLLHPNHYINVYTDHETCETYYTTTTPRDERDQFETSICPYHLDDWQNCDCLSCDSLFEKGDMDQIHLRRFTPLECERLQGFPDNWTATGNYNGRIKPVADTNRYELIGNSIQINTLRAVIEQMTHAIGEHRP